MCVAEGLFHHQETRLVCCGRSVSSSRILTCVFCKVCFIIKKPDLCVTEGLFHHHETRLVCYGMSVPDLMMWCGSDVMIMCGLSSL